MTGNEIAEKYGPTLCALRSYYSVGFFSREYAILQSEKILIDAEKEFEEASIENKEKLRKKVKIARLLTYRELYEKMFLCIEDLTAILFALLHPLEEFHIWIVKAPNAQKVLQDMTDEKICRVLKYGDICNYAEDEIQIIKNYRDKTITSHKYLFETILQFYKLNEKAYIRMKHGNSLFYNLDTIKINEEDTFIIPVEYNPKSIENVNVILLNQFIYDKTYKLFQYVQDFLRIICEINIEYITSGEFYHPVGLVICPETENDQKIFEEIVKKYTPSSLKKYNINTKINLTVKSKKLDDIMTFFKNIPL